MPRARANIPAVPLVRTDGAEPTLADRYELRSVLGSGGMGTVWEAYDRRLGRTVALKILRDDLPPSAAARLEREARAAARIRDPRVVTVLDLDRTPDGAPYLVLECHDGHTLADELRDGPLDAGRLDRLVEDLLGALAAAHRSNVLHRDVKPANVLSDPEGFRVTDFGLASLDDDQTTETDLMGTLVYVAPERLDGARGSTRSDVFSAAVVLHEAATGVQPFRAGGADPAASVARLRAGDVPPLPDHLPAALRSTIEAALSPDPEQRPGDAGEMLAAIRGQAATDPGPDPTIRLDATAVLPTVGPGPKTGVDRPDVADTNPHPAVAATSHTIPAPALDSPAPNGPAPRPAPTRRPLRQHPAVVRSRRLIQRHGRRPEVVIGVIAAAILALLLLVVALDDGSADPEPNGDPAAEQGAEVERPADLGGVLDRIEEIGR